MNRFAMAVCVCAAMATGCVGDVPEDASEVFPDGVSVTDQPGGEVVPDEVQDLPEPEPSLQAGGTCSWSYVGGPASYMAPGRSDYILFWASGTGSACPQACLNWTAAIRDAFPRYPWSPRIDTHLAPWVDCWVLRTDTWP